MSGGSHFTTEGVSYCYDGPIRRKYEDNIRYQTSFIYSIEDSVTGGGNPNLTFRRRKANK